MQCKLTGANILLSLPEYAKLKKKVRDTTNNLKILLNKCHYVGSSVL